MNFSSNLKNLRKSQNVTQEQLADYLKVSRPTIAGYETKSRQPDFDKLEKISKFFDISIDYLLTGSERCSNHNVPEAYNKLSPESKQDVLKYIELLQLRDKKTY